MKRGCSKWLGTFAVAATLSLAGPVAAQMGPAGPGVVAPDDAGELQAPVLWPLEPEFDRAPGWSIGLDAYAGFAVLGTSDGGYSHAFLGGLSRFQWSYLQIGAFIETTDGGEQHWRSIGGFAGAFIPFRHWVDFEFAAGAAARTYREDSFRYGPDGYEATTPALTFRAGFSDRSLDGLFGFRLGGHLTGAIDLDRQERAWRYELETTEGDVRSVSGATKIGGVSVGIAVTAGFDIGRKPAL
jgi:hypothetical protein